MAFVCIRRYDTYVPAHIALGKLLHAGIKAHLQDEHTVTIDPLLNLAVGGIKLFVLNEEVEIAEKILNENPETENIA
jgi:hypothetical protein